MLSDLYLRSRSQSPSHLALNALAEGTSEQRRRMVNFEISLMHFHKSYVLVIYWRNGVVYNLSYTFFAFFLFSEGWVY